MTLREHAKLAIEVALGSAPVAAVGRRLRRGQRLVLAYHNVVESPVRVGGDTALHLPLAQFRAQLDVIAELRLEVVPVSAPLGGENAPPTVSITFDDAYQGAIALALPELVRRGLPATVFVTPGLLGHAAAWWDRLADAATGSVPDRLRERILWEGGGGESRAFEIGRACGSLPLDPVPEFAIASLDGLRAATTGTPGITIGAHSWSHPNLAALRPDALADELARPREWLEQALGPSVIPWLAYPYGLESATTRDAARRAGYVGAVRVDGGWTSVSEDPMARSRLAVGPRHSIESIRSWLGGLRR